MVVLRECVRRSFARLSQSHRSLCAFDLRQRSIVVSSLSGAELRLDARFLSSTASTVIPEPPVYDMPELPPNLIIDDESVLDPKEYLERQQKAQFYTIPEGPKAAPYFKMNNDELVFQAAGEKSLSENVWNTPVKEDVIHRVVRYQLANRRQGTAATKGISQVSGSGRKPFAQKGSGRARQGSTREPQMRGGADPHPKRARDFSHKLNKKIRRFGLRAVLAARMIEKQVYVVDSFERPNSENDEEGNLWKTREISKIMASAGWEDVAFIDKFKFCNGFRVGTNNLNNVIFLNSKKANVLDILKRKTLVISEEGLAELEERLDEKKQLEMKLMKRRML